ILSSKTIVEQPLSNTNGLSQATQVRRPRGRPRLSVHTLTDIANIHGPSHPPQFCAPNVLSTSHFLSSTTNVEPLTNTTNGSSQATQVRRPRGRSRLSARALTDITNIRVSSQPPQFCAPNILPTSHFLSSTTNVEPLTNNTNGSSQATQVRRPRGRPPLSARPLTDITNIRGSDLPSSTLTTSSQLNVYDVVDTLPQLRRRGRPPSQANVSQGRLRCKGVTKQIVGVIPKGLALRVILVDLHSKDESRKGFKLEVN
ncbi:reverse transcriptase domain-containing protein, partial [Tanacetum coccineum]